MNTYFLTPPGLYYFVIFMTILSILVYWKRESIKRELHRWRGVEVSIGPIKLKRQAEENKPEKSKPSSGVHFGEDSTFTGAKIKGIAGRDIRRGKSTSSRGGITPGVDFGKKGNFDRSEIEDIAGRDLEDNE